VRRFTPAARRSCLLPRGSLRTGRPVSILAFALALLAILPTASALADHEGSQHYSRSSERCIANDTANLVDPIGLVFLGFTGPDHSGYTDFLIEDMTDREHDWRNINGGDQWVGSENVCTLMEEQAGTPFFPYNDGFPNPARYHVRLNQNHSPDASSRFRTVSTPHYDVSTDECGDVVPAHVPPTSDQAPSGFDYARGHIKNDWIAAYGGMVVDVQNWKNTRMLRQCTGSMSNSTGRVYFLSTD
jgi:hypothetical protein